jgi:hypothetical protein
MAERGREPRQLSSRQAGEDRRGSSNQQGRRFAALQSVSIKLTLLVPCQVDRRTTEGRDIEKALQEMGERVGPAIGWRTAFGASDAAHDWIGAFAPLSRGHQEIIALTAVVHAILGSTQAANPHRL